MSMERCDRCSAAIDTDCDVECYQDAGQKWDGEHWIPLWEVVCENCREEDDERA